MATDSMAKVSSAALLAAIVDSSDDAIISKDLNGIVTSWNPAAERLFGYTAAEMIGRPIRLLAPPDRENEMPTILERIRRGEKVDHYETIRRRKDGTLVDVSLTVSPIRDETGRIVGASKIARDISGRRRVEQALRVSEQRFRDLANFVPDMVWTAAPDGTITYANDRWFEYCGIPPERNARDWPELVLHPDDRARCLEQWTRSLQDGTEYEIEVRNRRHDGEYRWFLTRAVPIRDAAGEIVAWFGSTTDIHDRKVAEEHLQLLAHELSHRVKNLLATVQALARQSLGHAASLETAAESFAARLRNLARSHDLLNATRWRGAGLREVISEAVAPFQNPAAPQIAIEGPDVQLDPQPVLVLALALHELATNAAKYGALTTPAGRVEVDWELENTGPPTVRLQWAETGGPKVQAARRRGFGLHLIERALAHELDGGVEVQFAPAGLRCIMVFPARPREAAVGSKQKVPQT